MSLRVHLYTQFRSMTCFVPVVGLSRVDDVVNQISTTGQPHPDQPRLTTLMGSPSQLATSFCPTFSFCSQKPHQRSLICAPVTEQPRPFAPLVYRTRGARASEARARGGWVVGRFGVGRREGGSEFFNLHH